MDVHVPDFYRRPDGQVAFGGALIFDRVLAANETSNNTTPALVTDANGNWTFAAVAGKIYECVVAGTFQTAADTTGFIVRLEGVNNFLGAVSGQYVAETSETGNPLAPGSITALNTSFGLSGVSDSNSALSIFMKFTIYCTRSGDLEFRWSSEASASNAILLAGTRYRVQELLP